MNTWLSLDQARACLRDGRGTGIKIAILDSGVDRTASALHGSTLRDDLAVIDDGLQLQVIDNAGRDVFGHGTAIAGIIHSLAPQAALGSFRVLGDQLRSRTAIIRAAAFEALQRGYHILNCSFGCTREDQVLQYKEWIDEAYVRGRHIVAACNNANYLQREWPGHFPTVITANCVRSDSPEALYFRPGTLVEFGARGHDVRVAWRDGLTKSVTGSSFAAPHVTGMLARLLSGAPDLPPLEAKSLLRRLALPWEQ